MDVIGKQLQIVSPLKSFTVTQLAAENLGKLCVEKKMQKTDPFYKSIVSGSHKRIGMIIHKKILRNNKKVKITS